MKQLIFTCALCITFFCSLYGQDLPVNTLTVKPVWINYHSPNNDNEDLFQDLNNGFEIGYNRHFGKLLSLGFPLRLGSANFPNYVDSLDKVTSYTKSQYYAGLDALLNLHFFRGKTFSPFIYAGIGGAMQDFDEFYAQAPIGLGFDIRVSDLVSIVAQSDRRFGFKNGYDNFQHAVGIRACLCGKEKDMDKDGVSDKNDMCPDVFGLASLGGCPDSDNDGIADKDDKCPNLAGIVENMGCPSDRDKDGVYDADDMCPDVAGVASLKGCPDSDRDGIADADDKCPKVAGLANLKGCPDSDKDGIADGDDKCPNQAGPASNQGCPEAKVEIADRDKDGVADASDKCPDVAGSASHAGCPDTDKDGIYDDTDRCPNTFGVASNYGCPEIKQEDKKVFEVAMKSVQFETGTATITSSSYKILNDIVSILNKYPEMMLDIQGNTDNVGNPDANQKLSERRAKACMDYLISKKISKDRLTSRGNGQYNPIADNGTKEGRQENRRTEFIPIWR